MILTGTSNLSQYPGISSDVHRGRRACTDMYTDWPMQCLGLLSTNTSNSSIAMLPPAFAAHAEECLDGLRKGKLTNPIRLLFSTSRYLEWKVCIFVPRSNCYHCRLFLVLHPAMGRGVEDLIAALQHPSPCLHQTYLLFGQHTLQIQKSFHLNSNFIS